MNRLYGFAAISAFLLPLAFGQVGRGLKFTKQDNVPPLLARAIGAWPRQRYVGTRIIEFRRQGQPVRYTEIVTRSGPNTRIEYPDGSPYEGQIIVETARDRRHFYPDRNEIHVLPPRRDEGLMRLVRLAKMGERVRFGTDDGPRIAGLGTSQLVVKDPAGNVLQRIYIEPRSGLMVKRELFDPVGAQVGLYEFKTVNLNPRIDASLFRLERKGARLVTPLDTLREQAKAKDFQVLYLRPETGFRLHFSRMEVYDGSDVLMQFYGSPKGRVSLYQTKADVDPAKLQKFARDQVHVYSWRQNGYTLVLVGAQDDASLKELAEQVVFGT